jgi:hypothetical protein
MEPIGPRRRSVSRERRQPIEEVKSPFSLSEEPPPKKRSIKGKIFLVGTAIPLLVAAAFLGALYLDLRKGVPSSSVQAGCGWKNDGPGDGVPGAAQQVGGGRKPQGVDLRTGKSFDFSLYPFLPWKTPIMNGKIVRDIPSGKFPRRILVRFDYVKEVLQEKEGASRSRGKNPDLAANVQIEY